MSMCPQIEIQHSNSIHTFRIPNRIIESWAFGGQDEKKPSNLIRARRKSGL